MTIAVAREMAAKVQFVLAISTAAFDSERPISIMIGPITTGGNRREMNFVPKPLIRADIKKYTSATPMHPNNAPPNP